MLDRLTEIRKKIAELLEEGCPLTDDRILELSYELDRIILGLILVQNEYDDSPNHTNDSQAG